MSHFAAVDNLQVMKLAKNYNAHVLGLLSKHTSKDLRALDFGAGVGTFADQVRERCKSLECIETDPDFAECLRTKGFPTKDSISSIPDESFDLVYSLNVLEHIEDDVDVLKEFTRVLKNEGKVFIFVPAFMSIYTSMDKKVGHVRRYTKATLKGKLESAHLKLVHWQYIDSVGFLVTLIFKYLGNKKGDLSATAIFLFDRFLFPVSKLLDGLFSRLFGKNIIAIATKSLPR